MRRPATTTQAAQGQLLHTASLTYRQKMYVNGALQSADIHESTAMNSDPNPDTGACRQGCNVSATAGTAAAGTAVATRQTYVNCWAC